MSAPLTGLGVVNTRALHQATELDSALITAGANPLSFPCIAIAPPLEPEPLDRAVRALAKGEFEWLVLTSGNAVSSLAGRIPGPISVKLAAIGPVTAKAIEQELSLPVEFVPKSHSAIGLAAGIPILPGDRVLLPASEIAPSDLECALSDRGAIVTRVTTYRTVTGSGGVDLRPLLATNQVDALAFASPSAVRGLLDRFDSDGGSPWDRFDLPAICIGATTSDAATALGFTSVVAATSQTLEELVAALAHHVSTQPQGRHTWR